MRRLIIYCKMYQNPVRLASYVKGSYKCLIKNLYLHLHIHLQEHPPITLMIAKVPSLTSITALRILEVQNSRRKSRFKSINPSAALNKNH